MDVTILSENRFVRDVLPNVDSMEDSFFISIRDSDSPDSFRPNSDNYRTYWFYDLEQDLDNGTDRPYKAITEEQAEDMFNFIKSNADKKKCFVHCAAGVSRSGAVGSFIHEYFGGRYKDLLVKHPNILPNGRVTRMLRMFDRLNGTDSPLINFI